MAESEKITSGLKLNSEIAMALSGMEAGCLAFAHKGGVVFAVKDLALAQLFEKGSDGDFEPSVDFGFEFTGKEEFPAVCAFVFIESGGGSFSYEYFFSLESEEDMENLARLERQKSARVLFTDRSGSVCARVSAVFDASETARLERVCKSAVNRRKQTD